jgi:hypothetical protein
VPDQLPERVALAQLVTFRGGTMTGMRYSLGVMLAAGVILAGAAAAQSYPSQLIRMVVGYEASGEVIGTAPGGRPDRSEILEFEVQIIV